MSNWRNFAWSTVREYVQQRYGRTCVLISREEADVSGRALAAWSEECGMRLEFVQPSKLVQNASAESFNERLQEERLNASWFSQAALPLLLERLCRDPPQLYSLHSRSA